MSGPEEFDDLIRKKLEEQQFSFDPDKWDNARQLIEADERRKRRGIWLLSSTLILAFISALVFYFAGTDKTATTTEPIASNVTKNTEAKKEKITNTPPTAAEEKIITERSPAPTTVAENKESIPAAITQNQATTEPTASEKETKATLRASEKALTADKAGSQGKTNTIREKVPLPAKQNGPTATATPKEITGKKATEVKTVPAETQRESIEEKTAITPSEPMVKETRRKDKITAIAPAIKPDNQPVGTETTPPVASAIVKAPPVDSIKEKKEEMAGIPATVNTHEIKNDSLKQLPQKEKAEPVSSPAITNATEVKKDSVKKQPEIISPKEPGPAVHPAREFAMIAGGNYSSEGTFTPLGGILFTQPVSGKWSIGAGLYYTSLPQLSGNMKTFTSTEAADYGFGYTAHVTEITTDKVHYLVLPLFVKYNLNAKNSLLAGTNLFYLFNASNTITTYKESYNDRNEVVTSSDHGYYNGFSGMDAGLMAGYERNIFGKFSIGILFNYGLTDIKDNTYYKEEKFNRNISGQLVLKYNLLK